MAKQESKRLGRPRLPEGQGKLYALGLRTTRENYDAVNRWAAQSGKSVAQEIEGAIELRLRLENNPISHDDWLLSLACRLFGPYVVRGIDGVIEALIALPDLKTGEDPDETERERRLRQIKRKVEQSRFFNADTQARYERNREFIEEFLAAWEAKQTERE